MNNYIVAVNHDNGAVRITVAASCASEAIELVMKAEGCPRCSIISVKSV